jgi:hypothetical protein
MEAKDRLSRLLAASNITLNGIDYVEIASVDQTHLRVHFLNQVALKGSITGIAITGGETIPTVTVQPINDTTDWSLDAQGNPILALTTRAAGDFSNYTLTISSGKLDPFFDHTSFSFKALCPTDLDCATPAPVCPPEAGDLPPIDYLAKDFLSFRRALSDFSALRYPEWQERSEADFGVMFLEALSSLADDLSYTQDRVGVEAALDTATQRRSIIRHARLVDYEPRPAQAARVLLRLTVAPSGSSTALSVPAGLLVRTSSPNGNLVHFEIGTGLSDQANYPTNTLWNGIQPYFWDDSQRCLAAGSTDMWLLGAGLGLSAGQALLIDTAGPTTADAPLREVVHVTQIAEEQDQLFLDAANQPTPVTHIWWSTSEALQHDHALVWAATPPPSSAPPTMVYGNLIPATQGRRYSETFAIPSRPAEPPPPANLPLAIARTGPNDTPDRSAVIYLYTPRNAPVAWLAPDDPASLPSPEIELTQQGGPLPVVWPWRRRLLDADVFEQCFTLDPIRYRLIATNSDGSVSWDYDSDEGDTIRFGDGVFGAIPADGAVFQVRYRIGGGAIGNVAADTITMLDPGALAVGIDAVTNPFPAYGGGDAEPSDRVRKLAPQKFRAEQYRAVRPEDYNAAAQTLAWVLRAGTVFRWTGSWLTVFTTADPRGTEIIPVDEHTQLIALLNRYRLAGYEVYAPAPRYASLDLIVEVCARPDAFRGDVEAAVLDALSTRRFADGSTGFFYVDRFTFGTPLERSALEAAIQDAYGVAGVVAITYRRRGYVPDYTDLPETVQPGSDAIIRVDNDPSRPEAGSLSVQVGGGK